MQMCMCESQELGTKSDLPGQAREAVASNPFLIVTRVVPVGNGSSGHQFTAFALYS